MYRYSCEFSYDGGKFFGWQTQNNATALIFTAAFALAGCICFALTLYFNHLDNKARKQAGKG